MTRLSWCSLAHGNRLRLMFVFCLVGWMTLGSTARNVWAQTPVATVVTSIGTNRLQRATGKNQFLAARLTLFAGDRLTSGANSKLTLLFSDGTQVRVKPGATLLLTAPEPVAGKTSFFRVLVGEIWARLRPGRAVQTHYVSLVVRGTEIDLTVAEDGTAILNVLEGSVEFFNAQGKVVVNEGQQSTARPGAAPSQPQTIANPGLIIEWQLDLNRDFLPRETFFVSLDPKISQNEAVHRLALLQAAPDDGRAQIEAADSLFDARRFEEAFVLYEKAQNAKTSTALQYRATVRAGYALLELNRLDEAATRFALITGDFARIQDVALEDKAPEKAAQTTAWTGWAWLYLEQQRPDLALKAAQRAVESDAQSGEAQLVRGIALMRLPASEESNGKAVREALELAATGRPVARRYQAKAWLSLLLLSQDDGVGAQNAATEAVRLAPNSALAHSSLSTAAFYAGKTSVALREAKIAVRLNPDSLAAQLSLSQAQLLRGEIEGAAATAAKVAALSPQLPQAHYLLGLADAARRDYDHAARSLRRVLQLAPNDVNAATVLARVETRRGHPKEAIMLLTDLKSRHPNSATLLSGLGETYYLQARYPEAFAAYQKATEIQPGSAVTQAGLARLALEYNRLNVAIEAGQKAVELAPEVGAFHATLGLAYTYSHLDSQAEREFRTALALDPQNALALVQLGIANRDTDERLQQRTEALSFIQGFLLDPAVSRDLLRGGIQTEIEPNAGNEDGGQFTFRREADDAKLNSYGSVYDVKRDAPRENADRRLQTVRSDTTFKPKPDTTLYFHFQGRRDRYGLPGTEANPVTDDRDDLRFHELFLGAHHTLGDRGVLWGGLFSNGSRLFKTNSGMDGSFRSNLNFLNTIVPEETHTVRSIEPELRFDYAVGQNNERPGMLSLGVTRPKTHDTIASDLFFPNFDPTQPPLTGNVLQNTTFKDRIAYAQLAMQPTREVSFALQLRRERVHRVFEQSGLFAGSLPLDLPASTTSADPWAPSGVLNFQPNHKTSMRFLGSRRQATAFGSALAPIDSQLSVESETLPQGLPSATTNGGLLAYELDIEHRMQRGQLFKLFAFRTTGHNLIYDFSRFTNTSDISNSGVIAGNSLLFDRIERTGVGGHLESPLGHNLFGQLGFAFNRTRAWSTLFDNVNTFDFIPAIYNGQVAPYHPRYTGLAGLNYVAPSGLKAGVTVNYFGATFQDTDDVTLLARPRLGSRMNTDLLLSYEPSIHNELVLRVFNLFRSPQFVANGIPTNQCRLRLEFHRRF